MRLPAVVYLLYFVSGLVALIYEVLFARALGHLLGASQLSNATIMGLFLLGLAGGCLLAGRLVDRLNDNPQITCLRAFAVCQVLVACLGMLVLFALTGFVQETLWAALHLENPSFSYFGRVLFCAILLVPAAASMGASFPFAIQALRKHSANCSQWLYGFNTIGAAIGVLLGGFVLLPSLGILGTGSAAASTSLVIAVISFVLSRSALAADAPAASANAGVDLSTPNSTLERSSRAAVYRTHQDELSVRSVPTLLIVATIFGAAALIFEVCWIRLFTLILGGSTYSLSAFLSVFLLFCGIGSLLVARYLERFHQPLLLCAGGCLVAALGTLTSLYMADQLPWMFIVLNRSLQHVAGNTPCSALCTGVASRWLLVSAAIAVPSAASGMVLPLLFTVRFSTQPKWQVPVWLYAANSCGAVIGAVLAGFFIIPGLGELFKSGIQSGLLLYCLITALLAFGFFFVWSRSFIDDHATRVFVNAFVGIILFASLLDIVIFGPSWKAGLMSAGPSFYFPADIAALDEHTFLRAQPSSNPARSYSVLFYREGLNSTVTVEKNSRSNILSLRNDGKIEAALPLSGVLPAPTSDLPTHRLLATLPIGVHAGPCSDVLVIGLGTGTTCGAALESAQVEHLVVAELEPAVVSAEHLFNGSNGKPLGDRRVTKLINDGRYVLSSSGRKFDAIICQPSDPWVNGSSELFSKEFFELAKKHLKPGGVMAQWLPLYSVSPEYLGILCRTFQHVFRQTVLFRHPEAGECILLGSDHPLTAPTSVVSGATWLTDTQLRHLCDALGQQSGDFRLNTDDNLVVEMECGQNAIKRQPTLGLNLEAIDDAIRH